MKNCKTFILVLAIAIFLTGCSVMQATSGPESKDLSVLEHGTDRYAVITELGKPEFTEKQEDGTTIDVFKFMQGQHAAAKAGKGILYGAAALFTLGISEIVTSPLEGSVGDGAEIQVKVTYDENDKVKDVLTLKDERWIPIQDIEQKKQD